MKKCKRCRFKSDMTNTCSNTSSEFAEHILDDIPEHNCTHFYSKEESENTSNSSQDTKSGFMLYDYKASTK